MARRRRARLTLAPMVLLLVATSLLWSGPVRAEHIPTLRMFAAQSPITVHRDIDGSVYVDPGVWIAAVGGAFELRVGRVDYDSPITLTQVDGETGAVLRSLPAGLLESWHGLANFATAEVRDADGRRVSRHQVTFCPNSWYSQRMSDDSPLVSTYPYFCGGGFFTRGMVWGIDRGWANGLVDPSTGFTWQATRRHYTVTIAIDPSWVDLLDIAPEDAVARVDVKAVGRAGGGGGEPPVPLGGPSTTQPYGSVPDVSDPPQVSLPDLIALPGWGMSVYQHRQKELLAFNATEWNEGPGTLVVEGFRGPGEDRMEAFQYFLVDGEPVGRAEIGELEFHAGGGHDHWHFEEFTQYSLLDADRSEVLVSGKQSWCLVNTDAIDLTVPNANRQGWGQELFTSCGGPGALWIREILDVGWGDTYSQWVRGQAFDITDLPNGTYYVRVHVNPTGSIHEATQDNNVEDRLIKIKGKPGNRRVVVPPWHGIDTEGGCYFCG